MDQSRHRQMNLRATLTVAVLVSFVIATASFVVSNLANDNDLVAAAADFCRVVPAERVASDALPGSLVSR